MDKFNVDDLINSGLVRVKRYADEGLRILKYDRKVFFKNLWNTDSRLLDCRGTIISDSDDIVTMPFTKVFNYKENGTTVDSNRLVTCVQKLNGFMAAASMHHGRLLVSTTGTIDSDYAAMARRYIGDITAPEGETFMFEICSPDDPHIVEEKEGAYLIGVRRNYIGSDLESEDELDIIAQQYGFMRPYWFNCRFGALLGLMPDVKHEGYMVRDAHDGSVLCKIKSPYYLVKKFFMRCGTRKLDDIWGNQQMVRSQVDEEYYPLINHLTGHYRREEWQSFNEQERRKIIEDYLHEQ